MTFFVSQFPNSPDPYKAIENALPAMMVGFFLIIAVLCIFPLLMYILRSIALYKLADRRGVGTPIFAWIPIASEYLLGQLTDDVDARRTGKGKGWGKAMLLTTLIGGGGFWLSYASIFVFAFAMGIGEANYETLPAAFVVFFIFIYLFFIVTMMLMYASLVLRIVCNFKLFEDVKPEKAILYTILSVAMPLVGVILLFRIRNLGYEKSAPVYFTPPANPYPYGANAPQYQPAQPDFNKQTYQQQTYQHIQQQQIQQQQQMQGQFPPDRPEGTL